MALRATPEDERLGDCPIVLDKGCYSSPWAAGFKPAGEPEGLTPREPQKQRNIFRDHFWRGHTNTCGLKIFRGCFGNGWDDRRGAGKQAEAVGRPGRACPSARRGIHVRALAAMPFKWPSTPSILPASPSTSAGLVTATNPKESIPASFTRTTSPRSCTSWASPRHISRACPWGRRPACGWRPSILTRSSLNRCTVGGRRRTPSSRPWSKGGRCGLVTCISPSTVPPITQVMFA